ncbi:MAG: NGG1p interacting factor NIF3 [Gammaproteobacteria bacterium]
MYKISVFIPETHLEPVKTALFEAGAGRIGDYDHCAWQCLGQGQFRPLQNSQPFIGQQGEVETVMEYKLELVCEDYLIKAAIAAMKQAHPYEEPAYDVWKLEPL